MTIRKVALTGGIASGKSLAGDYLRKKHIPVIDADEVVHDLLRDDADIKSKIRQNFGQDVFESGGAVDRKKLGAQVFVNPGKRKLLESWIHPKVREVIEQFFTQNNSKPLGVAMIPLLFESNLQSRYDEVWLLETSPQTQIQRLMQTRGLTEDEAKARISSQMTIEEKRKLAMQQPSYKLIPNEGTPDALYRQIDQIVAGP